MNEKLRRGKLYPCHDWIPNWRENGNNVRARWTGEKRPPRKGEWYLSGSIIEAYRAANDLLTPYHIAELVKTRTIVTTKVEHPLTNDGRQIDSQPQQL